MSLEENSQATNESYGDDDFEDFESPSKQPSPQKKARIGTPHSGKKSIDLLPDVDEGQSEKNEDDYENDEDAEDADEKNVEGQNLESYLKMYAAEAGVELANNSSLACELRPLDGIRPKDENSAEGLLRKKLGYEFDSNPSSPMKSAKIRVDNTPSTKKSARSRGGSDTHGLSTHYDIFANGPDSTGSKKGQTSAGSGEEENPSTRTSKDKDSSSCTGSDIDSQLSENGGKGKKRDTEREKDVNQSLRTSKVGFSVGGGGGGGGEGDAVVAALSAKVSKTKMDGLIHGHGADTEVLGLLAGAGAGGREEQEYEDEDDEVGGMGGEDRQGDKGSTRKESPNSSSSKSSSNNKKKISIGGGSIDYMSSFKAMVDERSPGKSSDTAAGANDVTASLSKASASESHLAAAAGDEGGGGGAVSGKKKKTVSKSSSEHSPNVADTLLAKKPKPRTVEEERENAERVDALLLELFPERFEKLNNPAMKKGKKGLAKGGGGGGGKGKALASITAPSGGGVGGGGEEDEDEMALLYGALGGGGKVGSLTTGAGAGGSINTGFSAAAASMEKEVKLLKRELKVKEDKITRLTEHAVMMGRQMDKLKGETATLTVRLREANLELEANESRLADALKSKKKALKKAAAAAAANASSNRAGAGAAGSGDAQALEDENFRLREREQALMDAIDELSNQNEDLMEKLKESMERELLQSAKRAAQINQHVSHAISDGSTGGGGGGGGYLPRIGSDAAAGANADGVAAAGTAGEYRHQYQQIQPSQAPSKRTTKKKRQ